MVRTIYKINYALKKTKSHLSRVFSGKWHPLNLEFLFHQNFFLKSLKKNLTVFFFKSYMAFIISVYEFDNFAKILIISNGSKKFTTRMKIFKELSRFFIFKWVPGMLSSRFIMCRDFRKVLRLPVGSRPRLNFQYSKTAFCNLYKLPNILFLSDASRTGRLAAREAINLNIPVVGLLTTKDFPVDLSFRLIGHKSNLNFVSMCISLFKYAIAIGKSLGDAYFTFNKSAVYKQSKFIKKTSFKPFVLQNFFLYNFKNKLNTKLKPKLHVWFSKLGVPKAASIKNIIEIHKFVLKNDRVFFNLFRNHLFTRLNYFSLFSQMLKKQLVKCIYFLFFFFFKKKKQIKRFKHYLKIFFFKKRVYLKDYLYFLVKRKNRRSLKKLRFNHNRTSRLKLLFLDYLKKNIVKKIRAKPILKPKKKHAIKHYFLRKKKRFKKRKLYKYKKRRKKKIKLRLKSRFLIKVFLFRNSLKKYFLRVFKNKNLRRILFKILKKKKFKKLLRCVFLQNNLRFDFFNKSRIKKKILLRLHKKFPLIKKKIKVRRYLVFHKLFKKARCFFSAKKGFADYVLLQKKELLNSLSIKQMMHLAQKLKKYSVFYKIRCKPQLYFIFLIIFLRIIFKKKRGTCYKIKKVLKVSCRTSST